MNTGYGQSKLAAEKILATASRQCGLPVSVVRVGQPWISATIRSSTTLGSFPSPHTPIDWVPVDTFATILERILLRPAKDGQVPQFYNVISEAQPWTVLLDALPEKVRQAISRVISLPEWIGELRKLWESGDTDISDLLAVRLVDFYTILGSDIEFTDYETANTEAIMGQKLGPLKQEILTSWVKKWDLEPVSK